MRADTDITPIPGHAGRRAPGRPLRAAAITIYATLLLLALAIPGSVVGFLRERPRHPATDAALVLAERAEAALDRAGIAGLYRDAKERFRLLACGGPDSGNPC